MAGGPDARLTEAARLVEEPLHEEIRMSVIAATESRSTGCSIVVELLVRAVIDYQLYGSFPGHTRNSASCYGA